MSISFLQYSDIFPLYRFSPFINDNDDVGTSDGGVTDTRLTLNHFQSVNTVE
jgi:hypothetical protein